jgi:hypothetical protein
MVSDAGLHAGRIYLFSIDTRIDMPASVYCADMGSPAQSSIQPRDYQRECLATILDRYKAGSRRQLVCLPTGTGKTVIFAQFPSFFRMKRRMLVLAHRAELLEQAREKLLAANPDLKVEIEQAGKTASDTSNVVVASVPTVGCRQSRRLAGLDPDQFSIVVIDEALPICPFEQAPFRISASQKQPDIKDSSLLFEMPIIFAVGFVVNWPAKKKRCTHRKENVHDGQQSLSAYSGAG